MNLFNLDLHISVIADIQNIFTNINTNIKITNWSLSSHNWVFNKYPDNVKGITTDNWKSLNIDMIEQFHQEYDKYLEQFDGFIVGHPCSFALLYEKYNKPIIVVNTCRYDMPSCFNNNKGLAIQINECFYRLQEKGLLYMISNNKADNAYFKFANSQINTSILPSLCLYTNMKWDNTKPHNKFLLYSGEINNNNLHPSIIKRKDIGRFSYEELMNYKGIIHIPYEASTMSIFEHISSGIPLFFPSKQFLFELWSSGNAYFQSNYWKLFANTNTPDYLESTNDYKFWIENADYYNIEGIYYFDSFEHLFSILDTFEDNLYSIRIQYIENRKNNTINEWNTIVSKIFS